MNDFIVKLHYTVHDLQQALNVSHSIKTNSRAPVELRSQIDLLVPEDDLENQTDQTREVYSLRRGRTLVKNIFT